MILTIKSSFRMTKRFTIHFLLSIRAFVRNTFGLPWATTSVLIEIQDGNLIYTITFKFVFCCCKCKFIIQNVLQPFPTEVFFLRGEGGLVTYEIEVWLVSIIIENVLIFRGGYPIYIMVDTQIRANKWFCNSPAKPSQTGWHYNG